MKVQETVKEYTVTLTQDEVDELVRWGFSKACSTLAKTLYHGLSTLSDIQEASFR